MDDVFLWRLDGCPVSSGHDAQLNANVSGCAGRPFQTKVRHTGASSRPGPDLARVQCARHAETRQTALAAEKSRRAFASTVQDLVLRGARGSRTAAPKTSNTCSCFCIQCRYLRRLPKSTVASKRTELENALPYPCAGVGVRARRRRSERNSDNNLLAICATSIPNHAAERHTWSRRYRLLPSAMCDQGCAPCRRTGKNKQNRTTT